MILKPRRKFEKYTIGRCRESCGYREIYNATLNKTHVVITVYDVEATPSSLFTDNVLSADMKKMPQETWILEQLETEQYPSIIDMGRAVFNDREIAYFVQEYYSPCCIAEQTFLAIEPEWRIVEEMTLIFNAIEELATECSGGHFNICPETIMLELDDDDDPIIRISGLDHAGNFSNGNPWFDTSTLNPCCRPPESYIGIFDCTCDVYALGMLMAFMFTGKYPYPITKDMSPKEIRDIITTTKPSMDGIPEPYHKLIGRAISKCATHRFHSVHEFSKEFTKTIESGEQDTTTDYDETDTENYSRDTRPKQRTTTRLKTNFHVKKGKGFSAVAGMDTLKNTLKNNFVDIIENPTLAKILGIEPPNMILYGPPGNGKTYIVERMAEECGMEYCYIHPSALGSIYLHGSQTMIAELFEQAEEKATQNNKGCLLMIDEIDAICPSRSDDDANHQAGEVAEFLTRLNNCVEKHVYVVGTTNRIGSIDRAILRAGRIDQIIYIGLPECENRKKLFDYELSKRPHTPDIDTNLLAQQTEGYTAADITKIVKVSSRHTFQACLNDKSLRPEITQEYLEIAINECRSSVSSNELKEYERQRDMFISQAPTTRKKIGF